MQKVLIVTYYWPPSAGGGVQRWLKLAAHLPEFGIEPVIFTPENPAFNLRDSSLLKDIPPGLEVWKFPILEPFKLLGKANQPFQGQVLENKQKGVWDKLIIFLRANLFIPDPRLFWVRPSVRFLQKMIETNEIGTVITTGPPHSMHLIGLGLKQKTGVKWVADFRDPWSKWDILDKLGVKGWARKRHRALEKKVIEKTDLLITVSPSWDADFKALGATKSFVLTNGFDRIAPQAAVESGAGSFVIAHVGMLNEMRNPQALWAALAQLCQDHPGFAADVKIYLAGIPSEKVTASIESYRELKEKLVVDGYLSYDEANEKMRRSAVLLLVMNDSQNSKGHIPGKLFEYLAAERPVLAIGDPEGDSAGILRETRAGHCHRYDDVVAIKNDIQQRYLDFKAGTHFKPVAIDMFSRRNLAMKLAEKLKSI